MALIGNRRGWVAVMCLIVTWMLWAGTIKSLGVMLPTLMEQFTAKTWLIGWMISIIIAFISVSGPLAAPLGATFGPRAVVMVSGVMVGGSLIVASFGSTVAQLIVILALGYGPGMSFANILTKVEIARRFDRNYATANGIAQTGNPLGLIVVAPLVKLCLDTYGWRGAFLVLGGLNLNLVVCGALLGKPQTDINMNRDSFQSVPSCEEGNTKSRKNTLRDALVILKSRLGISICLRLSFWIPAIMFICNSVVDTIWSIYYVNHIEVKGLTSKDAMVFITAAGVAKLFTKVGFGILVDKGLLKLRPALAIVISVPMICLIVDPWMNSYWMLLINVVIFAAFASALTSLNDVYMRELIGKELIACAFSWMGLAIGIISFCSGFLPGWLLEQTGNYDVAFVVTGCLYIPPLVALLIDSIFLQRKT